MRGGSSRDPYVAGKRRGSRPASELERVPVKENYRNGSVYRSAFDH